MSPCKHVGSRVHTASELEVALAPREVIAALRMQTRRGSRKPCARYGGLAGAYVGDGPLVLLQAEQPRCGRAGGRRGRDLEVCARG
jgi:hypothetical protein